MKRRGMAAYTVPFPGIFFTPLWTLRSRFPGDSEYFPAHPANALKTPYNAFLPI